MLKLKAKLFKTTMILFGMLGIIGSLSTSIVACGQHNKSGWDQFKTKALAESAINLENSITPADKSNYHWTNSDLATFRDNAKPSIVPGSQEIIATIVIIGNSTDQAHPINFDIIYKGQNYSVASWTNKQDPSWNEFKLAVMSAVPVTLLTAARASSTWQTFKWEGGAWQNNDIPEFDIFGNLNSDDSYSGMGGELRANENSQSISAIISIKGKEGLYNSNPIKAVISFKKNIYNVNNWVFSQTTQLQSLSKFTELANAQIALANNITKAAGWEKFYSTNWTDANHSSNILQWIMNHQGFGQGLSYQGATSKSIIEDPDKKGLSIFIGIKIIAKMSSGLQDDQQLIILSFDWRYSNNDNTAGLCFAHSWTADWVAPHSLF